MYVCMMDRKGRSSPFQLCQRFGCKTHRERERERERETERERERVRVNRRLFLTVVNDLEAPSGFLLGIQELARHSRKPEQAKRMEMSCRGGVAI